MYLWSSEVGLIKQVWHSCSTYIHVRVTLLKINIIFVLPSKGGAALHELAVTCSVNGKVNTCVCAHSCS